MGPGWRAGLGAQRDAAMMTTPAATTMTTTTTTMAATAPAETEDLAHMLLPGSMAFSLAFFGLGGPM